MRIAICDDSITDAEYLKSLCHTKEGYDKNAIDIYDNGERLIRSHLKNKYDIVFLDVDMPNRNGIEIGKMIKNATPKTIIIFSTSYPQYAIEAYECEAFHYLLKPCDKIKLDDVLNRAEKKVSLTQKRHVVTYKNEPYAMLISDIYYVEYSNKHIIYHTGNGKIEVPGRLSDVYEALKGYGFYQVHQGYIVNFEKVRRFDKYSVILNNGANVMVSVRKRTESLCAYSKYVEMYI